MTHDTAFVLRINSLSLSLAANTTMNSAWSSGSAIVGSTQLEALDERRILRADGS